MTDEGPASEGTGREQELLREIASLRARIAELEGRRASPPSSPPTSPPTSPPGAPPAPPDRSAVLHHRSHGVSHGLSLEQFIGRRVVPFMGAIAVLGAVGYLVNYAIEIGLIGRIPPEARFCVGMGLGLLLLAGGEFVRRRGAPGAASGLDAAGAGALMVTVALGVFTLGILEPATGAGVAIATGVLAAVWSVRSGSVAVSIVSLIGCFAMPSAVGLVRDAPLRAGALLFFATLTGLATHLFGGARFAVTRMFTLGATIVLAVPVLSSLAQPIEVFCLALVWWLAVIASAFAAALRGIEPRRNALVATIASAALVCVEIIAWPSGTAGVVAIDFLPSLAGAILLGLALVLRPMAFDPQDAEERASLGQQGVAIGAACGVLAGTFAALALALGLGGAAFVVGPSLQAIVLALTAAAAAWIGRRRGGLAFDLVAFVLAVAGLVTGFVIVIAAPAVTATVALPFASGVRFELAWSGEIAAFGVAAAAAFVLTSMVRTTVLAALLAPCAILGWSAFGFVTMQGVHAAAVLVAPALATAWTAPARRSTVVAAGMLCALAAVIWIAFAFDDAWGVGGGGTGSLVAVVVPWIAAVITLARHPSFGRLGGVAGVVAVTASGGGLAVVSAVVGSHAGYDGMEAGFSMVLGLAAASLLASIAGRGVAPGSALAVAVLGTCGAMGFVRILDAAEPATRSITLELGALAAALIAAAAAWLLRRGHTVLLAVAGFAVPPFAVLLLDAATGGDAPAALVVGALVAIGIAQLVVGFRRDLPWLRWAGLACFGVIVLRLYVVDLAQAPMLVRIGLLFVSGMVLVGTGVVYARWGRIAPPRTGA